MPRRKHELNVGEGDKRIVRGTKKKKQQQWVDLFLASWCIYSRFINGRSFASFLCERVVWELIRINFYEIPSRGKESRGRRGKTAYLVFRVWGVSV